MNIFLFWVLPPLVGAVIGYVTNAVAIKMLFRPLHEIKIFRRRLPFTPGILPKERHKLAESIGRMVEQELFTAEVLKERLAQTDVREKITTSLADYTDQLLKLPLLDFLENRDEYLPFTELLKDFIYSDVFDSLLDGMLKNKFTNGLGEIGELFVPPARHLIKNGLVRDFRKRAQHESPLFLNSLYTIVEKYPGISLGEFLSLGGRKKSSIDKFLAKKTVDTIDKNIEGTLSSVNVKTLVSDRINSLDMLSVEKIILDIMANQLKWINFFGAILGALIGLLQVFLSLVQRTLLP